MPRITVHTHGGIADVVLDHADRHNALDWPMMRALVDTPARLSRDRSLRAVVLRGAGPSFCSGLDFPRMTKVPHRLVQGFVTLPGSTANVFQQVTYAWRNLPVPVIAVLHGRCYGGGMQLALAADFRITSPDCELSIMEAKWGLIPDMAGTVALRELVGIDQAKLLTYTGRVISGIEAKRIGLVTQVNDAPQAEAQALAEEICSRSPDAVSAGKKLLQQNWLDPDEARALRRERRVQTAVMLGRNFREALKSNFEKRAPRWAKRGWLIRG